MADFVNKNDRQMFFNQIRGVISQKNNAEIHCSFTFMVGHENPRSVNCSCKKVSFDKFNEKFDIGDKVEVTFFITSKEKNGRWYTNANILDITLDEYSAEIVAKDN